MQEIITIALPFTVTILVFYSLYRAIRGSMDNGGKINDSGRMICPACGTRGETARHTKGHIGIEILLWLCFILPGLIYSIWRLSTKQDVCPACRQPGMIPVNTPAGRKLTSP